MRPFLCLRTPGRSDPKGARRIINGTDCDALIAGYHAQFRVALITSVRVPDPAPPPKVPDPFAPMANTASSPPGAVSFPPELHSQPAPSGGLFHSPSPAPAAPNFWSRLHTLLSRKAA